jgi:hypothetical protein
LTLGTRFPVFPLSKAELKGVIPSIDPTLTLPLVKGGNKIDLGTRFPVFPLSKGELKGVSEFEDRL